MVAERCWSFPLKSRLKTFELSWIFLAPLLTSGKLNESQLSGTLTSHKTKTFFRKDVFFAKLLRNLVPPNWTNFLLTFVSPKLNWELMNLNTVRETKRLSEKALTFSVHIGKITLDLWLPLYYNAQIVQVRARPETTPQSQLTRSLTLDGTELPSEIPCSYNFPTDWVILFIWIKMDFLVELWAWPELKLKARKRRSWIN